MENSMVELTMSVIRELHDERKLRQALEKEKYGLLSEIYKAKEKMEQMHREAEERVAMVTAQGAAPHLSCMEAGARIARENVTDELIRLRRTIENSQHVAPVSEILTKAIELAQNPAASCGRKKL